MPPDACSAPPAEPPLLERLSLRYDSTQDRVRLAGELNTGQAAVLWLTQRLLLRLVPHLCRWLEQHGAPAGAAWAPSATPAQYRDAMRFFAQQAASQGMHAQPPVLPAPQTAHWLVDSVAVAQSAGLVKLVWASPDDAQQVGLVLRAQALRQWLIILERQWREAQWPMGVWPRWMQGAPPTSAEQADAPTIPH